MNIRYQLVRLCSIRMAYLSKKLSRKTSFYCRLADKIVEGKK